MNDLRADISGPLSRRPAFMAQPAARRGSTIVLIFSAGSCDCVVIHMPRYRGLILYEIIPVNIFH